MGEIKSTQTSSLIKYFSSTKKLKNVHKLEWNSLSWISMRIFFFWHLSFCLYLGKSWKCKKKLRNILVNGFKFSKIPWLTAISLQHQVVSLIKWVFAEVMNWGGVGSALSNTSSFIKGWNFYFSAIDKVTKQALIVLVQCWIHEGCYNIAQQLTV